MTQKYSKKHSRVQTLAYFRDAEKVLLDWHLVRERERERGRNNRERERERSLVANFVDKTLIDEE